MIRLSIGNNTDARVLMRPRVISSMRCPVIAGSNVIYLEAQDMVNRASKEQT